MTLLAKTKDLLRSAREERSLRQIAAESGGRIEYDWLKRFAAGDIDDPSVNRIQELHDQLTPIRPPAKGARVAGRG